MIWHSNPGWCQIFSFLQNVQTGLGPHPTFSSLGTAGSVFEVWSGWSLRLSTPTGAKVKYDQNFICTPSLCFHGMYRDNTTFTVYFLLCIGGWWFSLFSFLAGRSSFASTFLYKRARLQAWEILLHLFLGVCLWLMFLSRADVLGTMTNTKL